MSRFSEFRRAEGSILGVVLGTMGGVILISVLADQQLVRYRQ